MNVISSSIVSRSISPSKIRSEQGADILLFECGSLKSGEAVTIVCDTDTLPMGRLLETRARRMTDKVELMVIPPMSMHGQEPSAAAARAMRRADLCVGITSKSLAHTQARRKACAAGARYLSLPDYSLKLMADPSLRADYRERGRVAKRVADAFTRGAKIRVTTAAGTDITMRAEGRVGNCCPGFVESAGQLGSPPDVESNVSPIEDSADGTVVVDGSIPYPSLGLLKKPVTLTVRRGKITRFEGPASTVKRLKALFATAKSPKAYVLAECGVGLNDRARLTGVMLTDEGAAGTMHFGFGSNDTVGGRNRVAFHLDFVFRRPTLVIDGRPVLRAGKTVLS